MKESQQVTTKEPQQVTTKDPKKVEAGRSLAAHNRKKRELKVQKQKSKVSQYYSIGAVLVVGVIGGLGYYIHLSKKGGPQSLGPERPTTMDRGAGCKHQWGTASGDVPNNPPKQPPRPKTNKFEMD